jgi:cytochrome P450
MSPMSAELPLPPGHLGLPWLGEVSLLLRDGYAFVEERARRHGPIFRTRILGRPTAVITGADANGKFIDEADIQRADAMPPHVQALFGGRGVLPLLDGAAHRARKRVVMAAFTPEAIASYLPALQRLVAATLARWADDGEVCWPAPLKRLAVEAICSTVIGLPPGPRVDRVIADYELVLAGFAALPLPFGAYRRGRRALERVLAAFEEAIHDHFGEARGDGLTRILAARGQDGADAAMTLDLTKRELHHVVVAGLIVWAWLMNAAVELDRAPEVRARLLEEITRLAPAGPLSLEQLQAMPILRQVVMEVRRLTPVVQVFFGRARRTFTFAGHRVPEGWMVLWGIHSSHIRPELYADPLRFDPDRFGEARAEDRRHPHAFVPNGAGDALGGHLCAGYQYAPCLLELFLIELVRGYAWIFPEDQDRTLDYRQVPPAPRQGLRVRLSRRRDVT